MNQGGKVTEFPKSAHGYLGYAFSMRLVNGMQCALIAATKDDLLSISAELWPNANPDASRFQHVEICKAPEVIAQIQEAIK